MPNFDEYSLAVNLAVFASSACAVGIAGTKITAYADELAERFQLSRAMLGLFLMGGSPKVPTLPFCGWAWIRRRY